MTLSPDASVEDFAGRLFYSTLSMIDILMVCIGDRLGCLLNDFAMKTGFNGLEFLPIEADFWRFYKLA